LAGTHPYQGTEGALEEADEIKIEVTVTVQRLAETLAAVRAVHPYEEPVIQVIPLMLSIDEKKG
ncbi:MAG: cytochrome C biogenesis protein, partial [Oscillospiraceae bacterium]|nr:cytochrome C biogenesis protein [Oscillospiraceae bacterium]